MISEFETLNLENAELQKIKQIVNWYLDTKSSIHLFVNFNTSDSRQKFLEREWLDLNTHNVVKRGRTKLKILSKKAVQFDVHAFNKFFEEEMKKGRAVTVKKVSLIVSLLKGSLVLSKIEDSRILKNFYYLLYNEYIKRDEELGIYYPTEKAREILENYETNFDHILKFEDKKPEPGKLLYSINIGFEWLLNERIYKLSNIKLMERFIVEDNSPAFSISLINLENGKKILISPDGYMIYKTRFFLPSFHNMTWIKDPTPLLKNKKYQAISQTTILADGEGLVLIQDQLSQIAPELSLYD